MMRSALIAAVAILATGAAASAQYPAQPYGYPQAGPFYQAPAVMPNIYNPANQPLSPYLNLLRNSNPATNYYYGVRPGTTGGTGLGIGAPSSAPGGNRPLFFPQLAGAPDPAQPRDPFAPREAGKGDALPPAGHPVYFNNTMGYFPVPGGQRGGMRPGLAGVGTTRPPGR
jgi:hypothetical protein